MNSKTLDQIRNYKISARGKAYLKKEIKDHFQNYQHEINSEFLEIAYVYLKNKKEYNGIEYRFLCWLYYEYKMSINIKTPFIVKPVKVDKKSLELNYLQSEKRKQLFMNLIKYIDILKESNNSVVFTVLIGGSFTDADNDSPKDIDLVILIPDALKNNTELHENYHYAKHNIPDGVDLKFLPLEYNLNKFKAYSHIVCLGNEADKKDKDGEVANNSFKKRRIIRLDL